MSEILEEKIQSVIDSISEVNHDAEKKTKDYIASLAMPPGSLGQLEKIASKLSAITGRVKNKISKKRICVFCADNGVAHQGVSSAPISVTAKQAVNMTKALTGMSSIAAYFNCQLQVVDVGIATAYDCKEIFNRNIMKGTNDISLEAAMSVEDCQKAILVGIDFAYLAKKDGIDILGSGEMGIANTTTSTAVLAALTSSPVEEITGRGGGLTDAALENKIKVIEKALAVNNVKSAKSITEILARVGGLDIAALCGFFLGAAATRIPVVIDGYISAIAALCAYRMSSKAVSYFFPSHLSKEKGYLLAVNEMSLSPYLHLDMRLGEGSGCPLAFNIIEAATAFVSGMATFENANINDDYLKEIRAAGDF